MDVLKLKVVAEPATADAGYSHLYIDSADAILKTKNDQGVVAAAAFDTASVQVIVDAQDRVEYRTISGGEAIAKNLTLAATPRTPAKVRLTIVGGCAQKYGTDFSVTSNVLSWNGLGLDGDVTAGDIFEISYFV